MGDITAALSLLPDISEVHVVSVKNECKELLLVIDTELEKSSDRDTIIHCIQINSFDNISVWNKTRKRPSLLDFL